LDRGIEIRVFDPKRNPPDWTEVIRPTQCAVFLRHRKSSLPLSPDGEPYGSVADVTCVLFDRIDAAREYGEAKVQALPDLCCEIFDAEGRAHPPLLVITHPEHQGKEDSSPIWSRRRKVIAASLTVASIPLFWIDWQHQNTLILPTFLGFNLILTALRFLYWDFGLKHRARETKQRLEMHRKNEAGRS
jgi:hypothetical protein